MQAPHWDERSGGADVGAPPVVVVERAAGGGVRRKRGGGVGGRRRKWRRNELFGELRLLGEEGEGGDGFEGGGFVKEGARSSEDRH